MTFMEDFINVNKGTLDKSISSMSKNWMLAFTGFVYTVINILASTVINMFFRGPLFIISGFVSGFITAALISNYLYLLFNVIYYDRFTINDFKSGFTQLLGKVYSVLVIAWIARYFLSIFGVVSMQGASTINSIIGLLIMIFLNALPETMYQKHYGGIDNLTYSLNFIKDNAFIWFIPNVIMGLILFLITGQGLGTNVLRTGISMGLSLNPVVLIRNLLGQVVFTFMMIYRGHLFKLLSTSTKRKREFMNNF